MLKAIVYDVDNAYYAFCNILAYDAAIDIQDTDFNLAYSGTTVLGYRDITLAKSLAGQTVTW